MRLLRAFSGLENCRKCLIQTEPMEKFSEKWVAFQSFKKMIHFENCNPRRSLFKVRDLATYAFLKASRQHRQIIKKSHE